MPSAPPSFATGQVSLGSHTTAKLI